MATMAELTLALMPGQFRFLARAPLNMQWSRYFNFHSLLQSGQDVARII